MTCRLYPCTNYLIIAIRLGTRISYYILAFKFVLTLTNVWLFLVLRIICIATCMLDLNCMEVTRPFGQSKGDKGTDLSVILGRREESPQHRLHANKVSSEGYGILGSPKHLHTSTFMITYLIFKCYRGRRESLRWICV